jgi:hypothetical protein
VYYKSPVHDVDICGKKSNPQEKRVFDEKVVEICPYQYAKKEDRCLKEEVVPEGVGLS